MDLENRDVESGADSYILAILFYNYFQFNGTLRTKGKRHSIISFSLVSNSCIQLCFKIQLNSRDDNIYGESWVVQVLE